MPAIFEQIMLQSFRIHYRLDQIPPWQKRIKKSCLWIWDSSQTVIGRTHPSVCPEHTWLFDAVGAMNCCKKIMIFKKITSAVSESVSNSVEIQSRLTFSCKSWKNVSQIIDFADFLSDFYDFLHFGRFLRLKNTILCKFADKILKRRKFCQRRIMHIGPMTVCRLNIAPVTRIKLSLSSDVRYQKPSYATHKEYTDSKEEHK